MIQDKALYLSVGKAAPQEEVGATVTGDIVASQDLIASIGARISAIEDRISGPILVDMIAKDIQPDGLGSRAQQVRISLCDIESRLMKILEVL